MSLYPFSVYVSSRCRKGTQTSLASFPQSRISFSSIRQSSIACRLRIPCFRAFLGGCGSPALLPGCSMASKVASSGGAAFGSGKRVPLKASLRGGRPSG